MKINEKKLYEIIEEVIYENKENLSAYMTDYLNVTFQSVNIKKNKNREDYNIAISIDEIETPLIVIRDIIEEVCNKLNIKIHKIMVEL